MRERRHTSGNSNMARPASARSPLDRRTGGVTARRPDPESPQPKDTTKRRIHSARIDRPRSSLVVPSPAPEPERTINRAPPVLPQLPKLPISTGAQVEWAVKVPVPETAVKPVAVAPQAPPPPAAEDTIPPHLQPVLREFSALLRDRYEGKRSLRLAFLNWDRDKDGQLSLQEIRDMINVLGLTKKLGMHKVEAILDHVASTPSQSLRYDDFRGYVYSNTPRESVETKGPVAASPELTKAKEESQDDDIVLSSDRALYPDVDRVVNILRKKYETRQLRQVFRHWDTDKDGCVALEELDGNLRRQGVKLPRQQLHQLFNRHDADTDGRLTYNEFVEMIYGPVTVEHHNPALQAHLREAAKHENQPHDPYQILKNAALKNPHRRIDEDAICAAVQEKLRVFAPRIHDAYTAFDDDRNGHLSYVEFRQGLDVLGLHFTQREFAHLASIVDTDGSGEISFREFSNLCTRRTKSTSTSSDASKPKASPGISSDHPDILEKQRASLSKGTFDFSHLTRRTKIATRFGRTPYPNTKDLLSPTDQDHPPEPQRFQTEASLYGSGQTPRSQPHKVTGSTPTLTLGQEEKQRKDANYAKRLEQIRSSQHEYTQRTAPLQDAYETSQQRRTETVHRQQQRYQTSVEEHRPQYSPSRVRKATAPPYINN